MLDKSDRSYTNDDEDALLAAAIAAVHAYIRAEELSASPAVSPPAASGWASEALLEGTSAASKVARPLPAGVRSRPWFGAGLKYLVCLTLLAWTFFKTPALAQAEMPPVAPGPAMALDKPLILRVGVVPESQSLQLSVPDGAEICDRQSGCIVARLSSQGKWTVAASNQALAFSACAEQSTAGVLGTQPIRPVVFRTAAPPASAFVLPLARLLAMAAGGAPAQPQIAFPSTAEPGAGSYVVVPPQPDGLVAVNGRLYRGLISLQPCAKAPGKICAINVVDLEDYLLSVVPAEMPSSWPAEALKAQAIVARSYALSNRGKFEARGFDVKATAEDQVYSGVCGETAATNQAVADTAGIILTYRGKPASAFFHSTSGGYTEIAENVWGSSAPYLQSVPDYDDASPHFSWSRKFSLADINQALFSPAQDLGEVLGLFVVSRAPSARCRQVLVVGSRDTRIFGADAIRRLLKLPSTNFNVGSLPDCYEFAGRGFGHGLGMSQWGAKALAEQGYNAAQILKYYYKDVALDYHESLRRSDERNMAASFPGQ